MTKKIHSNIKGEDACAGFEAERKAEEITIPFETCKLCFIGCYLLLMESRVMGNYHARFWVGENVEA